MNHLIYDDNNSGKVSFETISLTGFKSCEYHLISSSVRLDAVEIVSIAEKYTLNLQMTIKLEV